MALHRRLTGRLFYCLISVAVCVVLGRALPPPGPATTVIQDVIYRADGTPAQGTLLISWPAFVTADHKAVAAGTLSVAIGPGGAISLALIPNQGATPAGTYYRVLLKLDDGTTATEYWSVPTTSPTTISAVRTTVSASGAAVAQQQSYYQYLQSAGVDRPQRLKLNAVGGLTATDDAANGRTNLAIVYGTAAGTAAQGNDARITGAEQTANKNATNGYAGLDSSGHLVKPAATKDKAFVNVVTDCGAVGNGVTDDGPAIQTCLNNNPSKRIRFPKTQAGGAIDYYSSVTLKPRGADQVWEGEAGGGNNGVTISFPADTTGISCANGQAQNVVIRNLNLRGGNLWTPTSLSTYVLPADLGGAGALAHGVDLHCNSATVENVFAQGFADNGFYCHSEGTNVSSWSITSNVATVTTASAHNLPAAWLNDETLSLWDTNGTFLGSGRLLSTPNSTSFTMAITHANASGSGGSWAGGFCDSAAFRHNWAQDNRGLGFYARGSDANVVSVRDNQWIYNQVGGQALNSFLGGVSENNHTSANAADSTTPDNATSATSITRSSSVASVVLASPLTLTAGTRAASRVNVSGCSDAGYNGDFSVYAVADSTHFTYLQPATDASAATGCTVKRYPGSEVWAAANQETFAFEFKSAVGSVSINDYSESNQPPSRTDGTVQVLGGDHGAGWYAVEGNLWLNPFRIVNDITGMTFTPFAVRDRNLAGQYGRMGISFGRGYSQNDQTILRIWDSVCGTTGNCGTELRRTVNGSETWLGWRTQYNSDLSGFVNYSFMHQYGVDNPAAWFPNGYYFLADTYYNRRVFRGQASAAPSSGLGSEQGSIFYQVNPASGGYLGWINTTNASFTGYRAFGLIAKDATGTLWAPPKIETSSKLADATDPTKLAQFDVSNIATATTRTVNIPDANSTTVQPDTGASNQFLTAVSAQGVISKRQPNFADLAGTIGSAQQNNPGVGARGGVESKACTGTDKISAIGTDGVPVCSADQTGGGGSSSHNLLSSTHTDTLAAAVLLGDMLYGNATPAWQRLAGNTAATRKFLRQTGDSTNSAAPAWDTLQSGDIPSNAANTTGNAATATALAANGTNCSANQFAQGVDASGNAEGCSRPRVRLSATPRTSRC